MSEAPLLMVVDDDPSVLLLVDVLAEKMGFRVKAVSSGLQALEHLRDMPNVESTPVVAMSTAAVLDRYGEQLQVSGTLLKPFTQATLAQALERYR